jgi:cyclic pyranopterin phosphate synthase
MSWTDLYGRPVNYLRLSVVDRCDLTCRYCRFEGKHRMQAREELLSFEEIERAAGILVAGGIRKIRFTGGEPLLRRGIDQLVAAIHRRHPEVELVMTTNGVGLERLADRLRRAGLRRINISLDTLDPDRYERLTGRRRLEDALRGIEAARRAGFDRIRLNVVVLRGVNRSELPELLAFAVERGLDIAWIELMRTEASDAFWEDRFVPIAEVFEAVSRRVPLVPEDRSGALRIGPPSTNGPGRRYRIKGTGTRVDFIGPYREDFCDRCNRLRLDASGRLYTCLFSFDGLELKPLLRGNESDGRIAEAVDGFLKRKWFRRPTEGVRGQVFELGG